MRMKEDEWDDVINTNLKGVFLCTKAVARQMMLSSARDVSLIIFHQLSASAVMLDKQIM